MLRTASLLPLTGPSTLGFDPARFQTKPPVCYRATWLLPGPDFHRQATTSLRTPIHRYVTAILLFCWAHESSRLNLLAATGYRAMGPAEIPPRPNGEYANQPSHFDCPKTTNRPEGFRRA